MKKTERNDMVRMSKTLRWRLTLFVFGIMLVSALLTTGAYVLVLTLFGKTPLVVAVTFNSYFAILILLCLCALIGSILANWLGKYYLRPLKRLIRATEEVKKGNFKTEVKVETSSPSEMGLLIQSFNDMVRELDSIELFRNDFINNFSHEFKTPIVSIRGFAKELRLGDADSEQREEYLRIIEEESDRLAHLSADVLELSKLENQQFITNQTEFFLDEQLRQCILLYEREWSEKNLEIIPELPEVRFFADEEMLSHVWNNLIGNAVKFTPDGGMIRITLSESAESVTVRVSDTGIGMDAEMRKHIFEKFYQGDPSHQKKGYGIGLTMAARIVQLCRGTITVDSRPAEGSTFTVVLPKTKS